MRLASRENNETIAGDKILSVVNLNNSQLILMERGDKLKKDLKKANTCFGDKNLYSIKSINEALENKKVKFDIKETGTWCCVCVENWTKNSNGICNECDISVKGDFL